MEKYLEPLGIEYALIPPRTLWHNGKVERSHRNDQRYFYDWEKFRSVEELNGKLRKHLKWSKRASTISSFFFYLFGSYLLKTQIS